MLLFTLNHALLSMSSKPGNATLICPYFFKMRHGLFPVTFLMMQRGLLTKKIFYVKLSGVYYKGSKVRGLEAFLFLRYSVTVIGPLRVQRRRGRHW
jgi:hypothetical protein